MSVAFKFVVIRRHFGLIDKTVLLLQISSNSTKIIGLFNTNYYNNSLFSNELNIFSNFLNKKYNLTFA